MLEESFLWCLDAWWAGGDGLCRTYPEMAGGWLPPARPAQHSCSRGPSPETSPHPEPSQQLTDVRPHSVGVSQARTGAQSHGVGQRLAGLLPQPCGPRSYRTSLLALQAPFPGCSWGAGEL